MSSIIFRLDFGHKFGGCHFKRFLTISDSIKKKFKKYFLVEVRSINEVNLALRIAKQYQIQKKFFRFLTGLNINNELKILNKINKENKIKSFVIDFSNSDKIKNSIKVKNLITKSNDITKNINLIDSLHDESLSKKNKILKIKNLITPYWGAKKNKNYKRHFSGEKYFILNLKRNTKKNRNKKEIRNIMISAGQTDPKKITKVILKNIRKNIFLKKFFFKIIIGNGFKKNYIKELNNERKYWNKNLVFIKNCSDISPVLRWADIGIISSGLTKYELCNYGVIPIIISYDKLSDKLSKKFQKARCSEYLGVYNNIKKESIIRKIKKFSENLNKASLLSSRCQNLIDGLGKRRVIKIISNEKKI